MIEFASLSKEMSVPPTTGSLEEYQEVRGLFLHLVYNSLKRAHEAGFGAVSSYAPLGKAYLLHDDGREIEIRGHALLPEVRVGYPLSPETLQQIYNVNRKAEWQLRNPYELLHSFRPEAKAPFPIGRTDSRHDTRYEERWLGAGQATSQDIAGLGQVLADAEPTSMLPTDWQIFELHTRYGGH